MLNSYDAFKALRKPQRQEELQRLTYTWIAKLPENVRPIELGRLYPRIANRLAAIWIDLSVTAKYLNDLLGDKRAGRNGFPPAIARELCTLRYHHNQISDISDMPWSGRCCTDHAEDEVTPTPETIRTADGTELRVAGSLTDLTDRNSILGLKRYADEIIANLPAGLIVVDEALRVLSVNRSFCEIFGLKSGDDVYGHELGAILPQPGLREQAQDILADGTTVRGIDVVLGEKRLRVAIAGIRLAQEDSRLLLVVEDVTELVS